MLHVYINDQMNENGVLYCHMFVIFSKLLTVFQASLAMFFNVDMLLEAPCTPFLFTRVSAKRIEKTFSVKPCFCHDKCRLFHTFYESQEAQEAQEAREANQCKCNVCH